MTAPLDDEENYPPRPRWIGWAIGVVMLASAAGVANVGWRIMQPAPSAVVAEEVAQVHPELARAMDTVKGADCLRCHGVERGYVGPSFERIGERYRARPDAVDYLAGKIRGGSVGEWGKVIMPRQQQVTPEQAKLVAQWLLVLPAPAAPATSAQP